MYATVPTTIPGSVPPETVAACVPPLESSGCVSLARPKSRIFAKPSFVTMTFSGFRSRCTIPAACALARPSEICDAIVRSFFWRQGAVDEELPKRHPVHQLHRHVGGRAVRPDVVDRDDIRVVER